MKTIIKILFALSLILLVSCNKTEKELNDYEQLELLTVDDIENAMLTSKVANLYVNNIHYVDTIYEEPYCTSCINVAYGMLMTNNDAVYNDKFIKYVYKIYENKQLQAKLFDKFSPLFISKFKQLDAETQKFYKIVISRWLLYMHLEYDQDVTLKQRIDNNNRLDYYNNHRIKHNLEYQLIYPNDNDNCIYMDKLIMWSYRRISMGHFDKEYICDYLKKTLDLINLATQN